MDRMAILIAYIRLYDSDLLHGNPAPRNWCVAAAGSGSVRVVDHGHTVLRAQHPARPAAYWDLLCSNELASVAGELGWIGLGRGGRGADLMRGQLMLPTGGATTGRGDGGEGRGGEE